MLGEISRANSSSYIYWRIQSKHTENRYSQAGEVGFVIASIIKDIFCGAPGHYNCYQTYTRCCYFARFKRLETTADYAGLFPIDASDFEPFP